MKRILLTLFVLLPVMAMAQFKIGFLSYDAVMKQMPEYTQAQQKLEALKVQYEEEAKRGEQEFQRKFAEFLQGQKKFPQNILLKRQAELQMLMETGIKFRTEADELLSKAETDMLAELKVKLDGAIEAVGIEQGFVAVLNTDGNLCPFVNPALGTDATQFVLQKLGLVAVEPAEQQ